MRPLLVLLRPQAQSAADVAVCHRFGWEALPFGLLRLQADAAALAALPGQWRQADAVFWVSPGAVDMAAAYLSQCPPHRLHAAVGAATAERLRHYGVKSVLFPADGDDTEAVLRLPYWRRRPGRLVIVRGVGGRALLGDTLRTWGWQVAYAEVYRREPVQPDWTVLHAPLAENRVRAVYATTADLLRRWFAQMPPQLSPALKSLLYLTRHPRVAAVLPDYGITSIHTGTLAQGLHALNATREVVDE